MTSPQNWTLYKTSKKTHQRIKESRVKFPILQWVPIWMTACCVKLMAWTRSARDQTQEGFRIKIIHLPRRENSLNCNEADNSRLNTSKIVQDCLHIMWHQSLPTPTSISNKDQVWTQQILIPGDKQTGLPA